MSVTLSVLHGTINVAGGSADRRVRNGTSDHASGTPRRSQHTQRTEWRELHPDANYNGADTLTC